MTEESKITKEQQDQQVGGASGNTEARGRISRREFLTGTAIAAAGLMIVPRHVLDRKSVV